MKRIIVLFTVSICLLIFSPNTFADEFSDEYKKIYENSNAIEIYEELPEETKEIFDSLGLDFSDYESINNLTYTDALKTFIGLLGNQKNAAIKGGILIITITLIASAFSGLFENRLDKNFNTIEYITVSAIIGSVFYSLIDFINLLDKSISAFSGIIAVFIPIFCGILIALGKIGSSALTSGMLLTLSEIITQVINLIIVPIIKIGFAFGVCSSVAPGLNVNKMVGLFRKMATFILSFCLSVFLFVFGGQSFITISADNAATKTAKFFVGSAVPIIGSAVSESLTAVRSCFSVLKSSVAVYSVFAVLLIFLPILLQTVLWKFSLFVSEAIVEITGNNSVLSLIENINKTLSFFLVIIISIIIMFIFSVAVISLGVS